MNILLSVTHNAFICIQRTYQSRKPGNYILITGAVSPIQVWCHKYRMIIVWLQKYSATTVLCQMVSTNAQSPTILYSAATLSYLICAIAHFNIHNSPTFVHFGCTNTFRTCFKEQKSILCMNSVFHNYVSAQILCHNTTLCDFHYSATTLPYHMFSTIAHITIYYSPSVVYFGCTNTYKTCSKGQKSNLCMNQCCMIS